MVPLRLSPVVYTERVALESPIFHFPYHYKRLKDKWHSQAEPGNHEDRDRRSGPNYTDDGNGMEIASPPGVGPLR